MTCGHCCATEKKFTARIAERDRRRYRRHGPDATTAAIVRGLERLELDGAATLLDVGGGVGVIAQELFSRGVATAVLVEAASSYLGAARAEAETRGTVTRLQFVRGDFAEVAGDIAPADVVTLDRVVCCYPDHRRLLARSAAKCRRAYAISYPRDRWPVRALFALQNFARRVLRDSFRTFVHRPAEMERVLLDAGLELASRVRTWVWVVDVYVRRGTSEHGGSPEQPE